MAFRLLLAAVCLAFALLSPSAHAARGYPAASNLLLNGHFDRPRAGVPEEWQWGEGVTSTLAGRAPPPAARVPAHSVGIRRGNRCLKIASVVPQYAMSGQYLPLDGQRVSRITVSGQVQVKNVRPGREQTDRCRVMLLFFDARGAQLGDIRDVGFWEGTLGWRPFTLPVAVPRETRRAQLALGLHNTTGVCWFDDLRLEVTQGDRSIQARATDRTNTHGWWAFRPRREAEGVRTASDVSFLLDPPAGRHGFVTTRPDGHLYFQDGTRARFWGVDIMAEHCFPGHALARRMAVRLARCGCNIVRLHHLDASWSTPNLFDPARDDTRHLSPSSLDRLDYLMAQFRRRGIYVYLDLLVNRHFKRGDGVRDWEQIDDGAKIVAHFDPAIIHRQQEYARQLLTHTNRYTGRRLVDEPQIVAMEVINEDSLFYEQWYPLVPPSYLRELTMLCRRLDPAADPAKHPFDAPTRRALYRIETGYYAGMRAYLRRLGVRCPTTGSNHWEDIGPALLCDSQTDYVDRHCYWDHPKGGFGWRQQFDNLPQLLHPLEGLVALQAPLRVARKPFIVTEWCCCWINDWIAEGPIIGAAYAYLQDWDAMIWFDYSGGGWASSMDNEFDIGNKPHVFGQWPAAALLFHRRDLAPLADTLRTRVTPDTLLRGRGLSDSFDPNDAYTRRLETEIGPGPESPLPARSEEERPLYQARGVTGSLAWSFTDGVLTVASERTASVVGWSGDRIWQAGAVGLRPATPFSAITVSSLDDRPLRSSHHLLITTAARAENSDALYNGGRTSLKRRGHAPILMQPVVARLTLPGTGRFTIWPLAENGRRRKPLSQHRGPISLGSPPSLWYEIERSADSRRPR
jgi:hypothetical protein